jgi:hypothetical protein
MIVGLTDATPISRMTKALEFEKLGFHMLLPEDYLHNLIDDQPLSDQERSTFIQEQIDHDLIFQQLEQDIHSFPPHEHILIPHITTPKQMNFITGLGGILIRLD